MDVKKSLTVIFISLLNVICIIYPQLTYATPSAQPTTATVAATDKEVVGHVVWAKGHFKAVSTAKTERSLSRSSLLYLHDTLITDKNSQAQIVFTDNSLMLFRPNTTFHITNYHFDAKNPADTDNNYQMKLVSGGLRTVTGWVGKTTPDHYAVDTPVATIGVRGTDFSIYFGANKKLAVEIKAGSIAIHNAAGVTELNMKTHKVFAVVTSLTSSPVILSKQPAILKSGTNLVPATSPGTPTIPKSSADTNQQNQSTAAGVVNNNSGGGDSSGGNSATGNNGTSGGSPPPKDPVKSFCL